jgi:uncharacterized protein
MVKSRMLWKVTSAFKAVREGDGRLTEFRPGGYAVKYDGETLEYWDGTYKAENGEDLSGKLLFVGALHELKIIYAHKTGSHAYGTAHEKSDTDIRVIYSRDACAYCDPYHDEAMDEFRVKTSETVEYTFYDVRRFVKLLSLQNPNILESLWTPEDCRVTELRDPFLAWPTSLVSVTPNDAWKTLVDARDTFVTANCENTFINYAKQQIAKAKGQAKFQNMEKDKTERKTPIDFCRVPYGQGSIPVKEWLELSGYREEFCGLVRVEGMRDGYNLFYDSYSRNLGYQGICRGNANDVALSSVPKGEKPVAFMQFNKDAYSVHCSKYRDYQNWVNTRNEDRWVTVQGHGQKIDGKNMLHCVRLLMVARDIASGNGVVVRRSEDEIKELLSIKNGTLDLQSIIDKAESMYSEVSEMFKTSRLPADLSRSKVSNIYEVVADEIFSEPLMFIC